jgi:hypothetical protein
MTDHDTAYTSAHGLRVWWRPGSDTIECALNDPAFHHPGTGTGLRIAFSSNPKSANYHPANWNRCVRALTAHGKPAPALIPEGPRRWDQRGDAA